LLPLAVALGIEVCTLCTEVSHWSAAEWEACLPVPGSCLAFGPWHLVWGVLVQSIPCGGTIELVNGGAPAREDGPSQACPGCSPQGLS
jgi:hypothetical protein